MHGVELTNDERRRLEDAVRRSVDAMGFTLNALLTARNELDMPWDVVVEEAARYAPEPGVFLIVDRGFKVSGEIPLRGWTPSHNVDTLIGTNQYRMHLFDKLKLFSNEGRVLSSDDERLNIDGERITGSLFAQGIAYSTQYVLLLLTAGAPWAIEPNRKAGQGQSIRGASYPFHCPKCDVDYRAGECTFCNATEPKHLRCPKGHCNHPTCTGMKRRVCPECCMECTPSEYPADADVCLYCSGDL